MSKQIVIEVSDEKYAKHQLVVGAIVGDASFLEARVAIHDVP